MNSVHVCPCLRVPFAVPCNCAVDCDSRLCCACSLSIPVFTSLVSHPARPCLVLSALRHIFRALALKASVGVCFALRFIGSPWCPPARRELPRLTRSFIFLLRPLTAHTSWAYSSDILLSARSHSAAVALTALVPHARTCIRSSVLLLSPPGYASLPSTRFCLSAFDFFLCPTSCFVYLFLHL